MGEFSIAIIDDFIIANDIGFTGKEYDADIELYYYNARWYDPETGRFISEDPAADPNNPNLYSYCGNNPTIRSDPNGEFWLELGIAVLGGIINWIGNAVNYGTTAQNSGGDFWSGFAYGLSHGSITVNYDPRESYNGSTIDDSGFPDFHGEDNLYTGTYSSYLEYSMLNDFEFDFILQPYLYSTYKELNRYNSLKTSAKRTNTNSNLWVFPVCGSVLDVTGKRAFGAGRVDSFGNWRAHAAIDLNAPSGTKVISMTGGKVINMSNKGWLGLWAITVLNDDGTIARYGEIQPKVKINERVTRGQLLGIIGANNLNGDHMLHIELYKGDSSRGDNLTDHSKPKYLYVPQKNYERRNDLLDPTFIKDLPKGY